MHQVIEDTMKGEYYGILDGVSCGTSCNKYIMAWIDVDWQLYASCTCYSKDT